MDAYSWYDSLLKPSWAPVAEVFQPVWIILYVIIFISFGAVFMIYMKKIIKIYCLAFCFKPFI